MVFLFFSVIFSWWRILIFINFRRKLQWAFLWGFRKFDVRVYDIKIHIRNGYNKNQVLDAFPPFWVNFFSVAQSFQKSYQKTLSKIKRKNLLEPINKQSRKLLSKTRNSLFFLIEMIINSQEFSHVYLASKMKYYVFWYTFICF
jgi:hypothetical protein